MTLVRAWISLVGLSLRRQLWSANLLMVMLPLAGCAIFVLRRGYAHMSGDEAFEEFSEFVVIVFASFVTPICALALGSTSIGGDREDRTLVFLLVRPIPRALVLLAKYCASLPIALALVGVSFLAYCLLAGSAGASALPRYLPALLLMTVAYVSLFHLFAVMFRHATIAALVYALLFELMLGNTPGVIKRLAVNFYGRSMIFNNGAELGLAPPDPRLFEPLETGTSAWWLAGIAAAGLAAALCVFQRREYRDLT
jgi:ABC-2 type transport system permease protein